MSTKIRVMMFEADNVDSATMGRMIEAFAGRGASMQSVAAALADSPAPLASLPPAPKPPKIEMRPPRQTSHRGGRKPRPLVCKDFPGRIFSAHEVRELCGLAEGRSLSPYVRSGQRIGGKHVFEYADEAGVTTADANDNDSGAQDGGDDESGSEEGGDDEDDDPPEEWGEGRLWQQLHRVPGRRRRDRIRNELIVRNMNIVNYHVARLHAKLPPCVEEGDLSSAGVFGLMAAIDAFDPLRGSKFATFASPRVHGQMLDSIRDFDQVPRLVRSRARRLDRVEDALRQELGREPARDEVVAELGLPDGQVKRLIRDGKARGFQSIQAPIYGEQGEPVNLASALRDAKAVEPIENLMRDEWWREACRGLCRTDRLIMTLYYRHDMTMKEIGRVVGVSESLISQRHSQVVEILKAQMARPQ